MKPPVFLRRLRPRAATARASSVVTGDGLPAAFEPPAQVVRPDHRAATYSLWQMTAYAVAFAMAYVALGGAPLVQAVFYSVGACIIAALYTRIAEKLTRKTVGRDWLLVGIWAALAVTTVVTERESISLILVAGLLTWLVKAPPTLRRPSLRHGQLSLLPIAWLANNPAPLAATAAATPNLLTDLALFFGKAGAFVFGSGLAIVPFLFGGVVQEHHWLTEQQFLDAVAVALISPGPVVITVAFIGYLVAGLLGATVAAAATFFPCYLFTVLPAPLLRRYGQLPAITAAVQGITAAAVGAIAGAVVVLGKRSIVDPLTLAIAVATYLLLWKGLGGRRIPEPVVVLAAAMLGLALYPLRS